MRGGKILDKIERKKPKSGKDKMIKKNGWMDGTEGWKGEMSEKKMRISWKVRGELILDRIRKN